MNKGYRGFPSRTAYEEYYSDTKNYIHELDSMETYTREAEQERLMFMSDNKTKACNLTETEVRELMRFHGMGLHTVEGEAVDRINYLNKRLMAFSEPDKPEAVKSENNAAGWGAQQND